MLMLTTRVEKTRRDASCTNKHTFETYSNRTIAGSSRKTMLNRETLSLSAFLSLSLSLSCWLTFFLGGPPGWGNRASFASQLSALDESSSEEFEQDVHSEMFVNVD